MSALSMNQVTTYRWSLEEELCNYRAAGFSALGAWRHKLSDLGDDAVDLIAESGMSVSNLTWAGGFTGSDGRSFDDALEDAEQAVRQAAALQAGSLVVYAGGRNNHTVRHAERLLRQALERMLDQADAAGVTLALKPMHPACAAEWTFLTSLPSALRLIDEYRTPCLKLALDLYQFGHDPRLPELLSELAPRVAIVHLGDRSEPHSIDQNRRPLGEGRLPLERLILGLRDAGYTGDFDVKLTGRHIEPGRYKEILRSSIEFFERVLSAAPAGK
jgi:sugar phosphate isomerase/epimerase